MWLVVVAPFYRDISKPEEMTSEQRYEGNEEGIHLNIRDVSQAEINKQIYTWHCLRKNKNCSSSSSKVPMVLDRASN